MICTSHVEVEECVWKRWGGGDVVNSRVEPKLIEVVQMRPFTHGRFAGKRVFSAAPELSEEKVRGRWKSVTVYYNHTPRDRCSYLQWPQPLLMPSLSYHPRMPDSWTWWPWTTAVDSCRQLSIA